jgi:hypothetical protein
VDGVVEEESKGGLISIDINKTAGRPHERRSAVMPFISDIRQLAVYIFLTSAAEARRCHFGCDFQLFAHPVFIITDGDVAVDVNDGHAHSPGLLDHFFAGVLIL